MRFFKAVVGVLAVVAVLSVAAVAWTVVRDTSSFRHFMQQNPGAAPRALAASAGGSSGGPVSPHGQFACAAGELTTVINVGTKDSYAAAADSNPPVQAWPSGTYMSTATFRAMDVTTSNEPFAESFVYSSLPPAAMITQAHLEFNAKPVSASMQYGSGNDTVAFVSLDNAGAVTATSIASLTNLVGGTGWVNTNAAVANGHLFQWNLSTLPAQFGTPNLLPLLNTNRR